MPHTFEVPQLLGESRIPLKDPLHFFNILTDSFHVLVCILQRFYTFWREKCGIHSRVTLEEADLGLIPRLPR